MKRSSVIWFIFFVSGASLALPVSAADGLALMKVEPGARPAGMAGAFVSLAGDPYSSAYNPAGAVPTERWLISLGHSRVWENVRLETGYLAAPLSEKTSLYAGIKFASVDEIESRQFPTLDPDYLFELKDVSVKIGLSRAWSDRLSLGLGIGYLFEKIDVYRGGAVNFDLGALYRVDPHITAGLSVANIGSSFRLSLRGEDIESRDISLPTTYRLGGSYRYREYVGALDLVVVDDEFHVHTGAEWNAHETLTVRAGYMFNYDSKNFTAGASIRHRNFTFDYGFVPYTNNLGTSHLISLTASL
ncbi:MAG: PorV/PorQ family protein [Candidatus Zixiibacteriota bacterium]|nr:MAG: PorV/PorQ family protein [candidate division Zixibacteria bacterium]